MRFKIDEAYSSTLPMWLRKRFNYTDIKSEPTTLGSVKNKRYSKYNIDIDAQANNKAKDGQVNLLLRFIKYGLDPSTMEFHSAQIPEKASDPLLKNPNIIPIFLLSNGAQSQVWAKGINDMELYDIGDGPKKAFTYIPMKEILAHCIDFGYVLKSEADGPNNTNDKHGARQLLHKEMDYAPYTRRVSRVADLDKSGYPRDPHKYSRMLGEIHAQTFQSRLNLLYDKLRSIRNDLKEAYAAVDFDDDLELAELSRLMSELGTLTADYNNLLQSIESTLQRATAKSATEELGRYFSKSGMYNTLLEKIGKLAQKVDAITYTDFEWN